MITYAKVKEIYKETFGVTGYEVRIRCPHPDHPDDDPSASVNMAKSTWHCFSCGRSGPVEDMSYKLGIDSEAEDLYERIRSRLERGGQPVDQGNQWKTANYLARFHGPERFSRWWDERGIEADTVEAYELGWDVQNSALVYPFRDSRGRLVDVVRRFVRVSEHDGRTGKYRYPLGLAKGDNWFAYHLAQATGEIWITEGAIDAIALREVGLDAIAQYGGKITTRQRELLERLDPKSVVLAYDQDDAGRENVGRFLDGLLPTYGVKIATWPGQYKDPDEIPRDKRREFLTVHNLWEGLVDA